MVQSPAAVEGIHSTHHHHYSIELDEAVPVKFLNIIMFLFQITLNLLW